jgi:hypothetical protein
LLFLFTLFAGFFSPAAPAQIPSKPIHFTDVTENSGIRFTHFKGNNGISINLEEFGPGVCVSDFDGDGWQDIYFVNGRDRYDRGISVRNALYRNNRDGTFIDVTEKAGVPGTGYGLGCVWGDYDNDGYKSNRDAMGARIRITAGGISQIREIAGGGSYLSQSDLRANFGLGKSTVVELVEIQWPGGAKQSFRNVAAGKFYLITEASDSLPLQKIDGR